MNAVGDRLIVGAIGNDNASGGDAGHARVFQYINNAWTQLGSDINGELANDNFGRSVSMNAVGDRVAIGADYHNNTLENLKSEYIDTGKVKFVFRDFPFNYPALAGSMMMRCVPSDVRYEYMNALYKLQKSWVIRDNSKTREQLYKIMQSGGMTQNDFDACLSNIDLENDLLEDVMNAQREYNIRSTPSFIINGVLYSGNKNIKEFRQIIDKILSQ